MLKQENINFRVAILYVQLNSVYMNSLNLNDEWSEYLENSNELSKLEKEYISFVVRWFEKWSHTQNLELNRNTARLFWKEAILRRERASWQLDRWAIGMRWYLNRVETDQKYYADTTRLAAA